MDLRLQKKSNTNFVPEKLQKKIYVVENDDVDDRKRAFSPSRMEMRDPKKSRKALFHMFKLLLGLPSPDPGSISLDQQRNGEKKLVRLCYVCQASCVVIKQGILGSVCFWWELRIRRSEKCNSYFMPTEPNSLATAA